MGRRIGWGGLLLVVAVATGCEEKKREPVPPAPTPSGSLAAASATALPAASTALDPSTVAQWNGTYESKTVKLETPKNVKDFTWKNDDGTKALGKGQLSMSLRDGVVSGDATGPLGPQRLSGMLDGKTLRLKLSPTDVTAELAMTGTGLGLLSDGVISGKLRCAGPNGAIVREVAFEIKPAR